MFVILILHWYLWIIVFRIFHILLSLFALGYLILSCLAPRSEYVLFYKFNRPIVKEFVTLEESMTELLPISSLNLFHFTDFQA